MAPAPHTARFAVPSRVASQARTLRSSVDASVAAGLSRPARTGTRTLEVCALLADGTTVRREIPLPPTPPFDGAFPAFARGSLLQTPDGTVAVEDLRPGDRLRTVSGGDRIVMWIGAMTVDPTQDARLCRIMPDSFGEGRPDGHLTLAETARILHRPPDLRGGTAPSGLLTPIRELVDAVNVAEVCPPTAVTLFHVALDRHAVIRVGGLECETFHPGPLPPLPGRDQALFLSIFPHLARITDFGPLVHSRAPDAIS